MKIKNAIRQKLINKAGCFVAWWILNHCEDGLIINRKYGSRQIIKVFSEPAFRNMIKPLIHKAIECVKVRDVVADEGYHGQVVVTCIDGATFRGYYLADGVVVAGLPLERFKKIISHVDVRVKYTKDPHRQKITKR